VALFATSAVAGAQSQTGSIFGKATDSSGGVLPGVSVTLTSPILLQPLTAVTSETGSYQFPRLEIGTYTVKFELTGFKTVVNEGIIVTVNFNAQVNAVMGISTVQETITVTGESPVGRDNVRAAAEHVPRRHEPHGGGDMSDRHLLRTCVPAADHSARSQYPRLQPGL
jgi:carboxypeptidase family protein